MHQALSDGSSSSASSMSVADLGGSGTLENLPIDDVGEDMPDVASMLSSSMLTKRLKIERQGLRIHSTFKRLTVVDLEKNGKAPTTIIPAIHASATGSQTARHYTSPAAIANQPQYTWIMESGQGEGGGGGGGGGRMDLPYDHAQGSASQLPLHFQQLLAASSLLWNPFDHRTTYLPPQNAQYSMASSYAQPFLPFLNAAIYANSGKKCSNCGATSTPSWRRCPAGKNLLCNACGLYQKLHNRPRPFKIADDGSIRVQRAATTAYVRDKDLLSSDDFRVCANCRTAETPLWRKLGNVQYCNACALFHKTHGFHRPLNLAVSPIASGGHSNQPHQDLRSESHEEHVQVTQQFC